MANVPAPVYDQINAKITANSTQNGTIAPDNLGSQENPILSPPANPTNVDAQRNNPTVTETTPTPPAAPINNKLTPTDTISTPTDTQLANQLRFGYVPTGSAADRESELAMVTENKTGKSGAGLDINYGIAFQEAKVQSERLRIVGGLGKATIQSQNAISDLMASGVTRDDPRLQSAVAMFKVNLYKDSEAYMSANYKWRDTDLVYKSLQNSSGKLLESINGYTLNGSALRKQISQENSIQVDLGAVDALDAPSVKAKNDFIASPRYQAVLNVYKNMDSKASRAILAQLQNDSALPYMSDAEKDVTSMFMGLADKLKATEEAYKKTGKSSAEIKQIFGQYQDIKDFAWLGTKKADYDVNSAITEMIDEQSFIPDLSALTGTGEDLFTTEYNEKKSRFETMKAANDKAYADVYGNIKNKQVTDAAGKLVSSGPKKGYTKSSTIINYN